jgi:hypothetical protein
VGTYSGPDINENGLVLAFDGANYKSFKGEATINLIPSPTINAYPTTGNGWGSYNTNQYNGAQYFSIGIIANVTSNVVTTSTNHPLRTYDVVTPQTTGGGVSAGVNYFIKKVSDTSFTLHAYNGSQDGSQGYISSSTGTHKVYDSIANDVRVSVNSTSFPTMWWGPPHLPNSGLVKELRYGEFNAIPNLPANDCIRLHYIRTDDVKDGMSYGVDCTVTPSSPVTISFYTRAANANAVGKIIQYQIYNYTGGSAAGYAWNFTLGAAGVWERQSFTYTPAYGTMISYWFPVTGGVYAWDWSCMQVEQKSYSTNFIAGTRGTTVATGGGWANLTGSGNNAELINGVRENNDKLGSLSFDGMDDYVNCGTLSGSFSSFTIITWFYPTVVANYNNVLDCNSGYYSSGNVGPRLEMNSSGTLGWVYSNNTGNNSEFYFHNVVNSGLMANTWHCVAITYNGGENISTTYYNGNATGVTRGSSGNPSGFVGTFNNLNIGRGFFNARYFQGRISQTQIYNKALTLAEIQQNFNALRGRFGL